MSTALTRIQRPKDISTAGITHSKETLTVALATGLINANAANRNVSEEEVDRHVRNMLENRWFFNGATLLIDRNGRFIDGQHRVAAFLKVNAMLAAQGDREWTLTVLIVRGLDPASRHTVDIGRRRSLSDELRMRGHHDTTTKASWTRLMHDYEVYGGDLREAATRCKGSASVPELVGLWEARLEPICERNTVLARRMRTGAKLPPAAGLMVAWALQQVDEDDADYFLNRIADGSGITKGHPVFAVRRLLDTKAKQKPPAWLRIAWVFTAWDLYVGGRQVDHITFTAGGAHPSKYPKPLAVLHP